MKDAVGRYRINVVAEMTGVPAATLRAWERRHGIPTPARTAASYRLYSDVDVAEVKRLRDLCASGLAIAEASRLVRGERQVRPASTPPPGDLPSASALSIEALLAAVRAFDPKRVEDEVTRAMYLGSAQEVFDLVLGPVMRQVGDLWHTGELSVAQEHLASEAVGATARALARLTQPGEPRWRALLACVEEEQHVIGLYGVAIQLAGWGIRSVVLGARTPPDALSDAIDQLDPDAVGLSVSTPLDEERASALVDVYAAACAGRVWIVGGPGAPALADRVRARGGLAPVGSLSDHRVAIERALIRRRAPRE